MRHTHRRRTHPRIPVTAVIDIDIDPAMARSDDAGLLAAQSWETDNFVSMSFFKF